MKPLAILLLIFSGAISSAAPRVDSAVAKRLDGEWYRGDGKGYNVTITLSKDRGYSAVYTGCLGIYGTARGTWRVQRGSVAFTPTEERGTMRKHLRTLDIEQTGKDIVLVPPDVREEFKQYGASSRLWCFKRMKTHHR